MRSFPNGLDLAHYFSADKIVAHFVLAQKKNNTEKCTSFTAHRTPKWLIFVLLLAGWTTTTTKKISRESIFKVCASCLTSSSAIAHKSGQFPFSLVSFAVSVFYFILFVSYSNFRLLFFRGRKLSFSLLSFTIFFLLLDNL